MKGSTQSKSQRRAAGRQRLDVWLPKAYVAKLDALCDESGYSRGEQIMAMIDSDADEVSALKTKKSPRPNGRGSKRV